MPSAKFIKKYTIPESFRNNKVKSMFDYDNQNVDKEYDINIPIEEKEWNIGLIVGSSGSGKTTIAQNCFETYNYFNGFNWDNNKTIIDNFSDVYTPKQIVEILSKVGFSSPPDWLKPYSILSNGQKFRVDLARIILESDKPVIFDEFTSVVDRQVAQISSNAIAKFIRKENKKLIAVSCHYDIIEWLQPNWIFDVDKNEFIWRLVWRRPEIKIDIRYGNKQEWNLFKKHHYLSADLNGAAKIYVAEINKTPVAFCAVLHFPHPKVKNMKKIHRIVVLPDYQGCGIGKHFLNEIATIYKKSKNRVSLVTSSPSFIFGLKKDKNWYMTRKPSRLKDTAPSGVLANTTSDKRLTSSFEYMGE